MCHVCFCKIVEGYGQTECTAAATMTHKVDFTSGNFQFCSSGIVQTNLLTILVYYPKVSRPTIISC